MTEPETFHKTIPAPTNASFRADPTTELRDLGITIDGEPVAMRAFDPRADGEYGFVFEGWKNSWLNSWTPWPRIADWERQSDQWRRAFLTLVKGKLSSSRVKKPFRSMWVRHSVTLIREHMASDTVLVACLRDDPGVLIGFGAFRERVVHPHIPAAIRGIYDTSTKVPEYVYVDRKFRGKGIGTALLRTYGMKESFKELANAVNVLT